MSVDTVNRILEPIFSPYAPTIIFIPAHRQLNLLNRLIKKLDALLFALLPRKLNSVCLRLLGGVPVNCHANYAQDEKIRLQNTQLKEFRFKLVTLMMNF